MLQKPVHCRGLGAFKVSDVFVAKKLNWTAIAKKIWKIRKYLRLVILKLSETLLSPHGTQMSKNCRNFNVSLWFTLDAYLAWKMIQKEERAKNLWNYATLIHWKTERNWCFVPHETKKSLKLWLSIKLLLFRQHRTMENRSKNCEIRACFMKLAVLVNSRLAKRSNLGKTRYLFFETTIIRFRTKKGILGFKRAMCRKPLEPNYWLGKSQTMTKRAESRSDRLHRWLASEKFEQRMKCWLFRR